MIAELLVPAVLRMQLASSAAIVAVLMLRPMTRAAFGAESAYRLWALPPICALASLFPNWAEFMADRSESVAAGAAGAGWMSNDVVASLLGPIWLVGALDFLLLLLWNEHHFHQQVREGRAGPAVVGMLWPRFVKPADYEQRFDAVEREMIRRHEREHIRRGDPNANAAIAAMQVLGWFNPLIHLAARCARTDQELACDATVIALHPADRRVYAETLFKTHLRGRLGLACAWAPHRRHPLETRVEMIARQRPTLRRYVAGCIAVGVLGLWMVAGVFAAPSQQRLSPFRWTNPAPGAVLMDLARD